MNVQPLDLIYGLLTSLYFEDDMIDWLPGQPTVRRWCGLSTA
jgi:hypothetical protein